MEILTGALILGLLFAIWAWSNRAMSAMQDSQRKIRSEEDADQVIFERLSTLSVDDLAVVYDACIMTLDNLLRDGEFFDRKLTESHAATVAAAVNSKLSGAEKFPYHGGLEFFNFALTAERRKKTIRELAPKHAANPLTANKDAVSAYLTWSAAYYREQHEDFAQIEAKRRARKRR
jgi:hypothetical protein